MGLKVTLGFLLPLANFHFNGHKRAKVETVVVRLDARTVHLLAGWHVVMPLASLVLLVLQSNVQRT